MAHGRCIAPHLHADSPCPEEYNTDWTDDDDINVWRGLTYKRDLIIHEALMKRQPVQYISGGTSLRPIIEPMDTCFVYPIDDAKWEIRAGDIVFSMVQPKMLYYTHMV